MEEGTLDRIGTAEKGTNPTVLRHLASGYAFIGDTPFLPGYCVLTATPQVDHLTDLPFDKRARFLLAMSLVGEALMAVCRSRHVNDEILGNTDHDAHAHIWPRYDEEPAASIGGPVWRYPREQRVAVTDVFSTTKHGELTSRSADAREELNRRAGPA